MRSSLPPLTLFTLLACSLAFAQEPLRIPLAGTFGPVRIGPGQTLRVCVSNLFTNALTSGEAPSKPLPVVVGFVDAINGVAFEPPREWSVPAVKGLCEEFRAPESQPDATVIVLLAPLSQQNSKQFSPEILPLCSATLQDGAGAQARIIAAIPLVAKVNILLPGRR